MADGLSVAAGVAQVAGLAGSIVKNLSRFVVQTKAIPSTIKDTHEEVETLKFALEAISEMFAKRSLQLAFERSHHANILRVTKSCDEYLLQLTKELPQLDDHITPFQKIKLSLEESLMKNRTQQIIHHISSRTTVLQLSLNSLSLGSLIGTRNSQDQIQAEIRKLTDAMKSANLLHPGTEKREAQGARSSTEEGTSHLSTPLDEDEADADEVLDQEIRDWTQSASHVAAAASLLDLDDAAPESCSMPSFRTASLEDLSTTEEDTFDPEPELSSELGPGFVKYGLEENQNIVRHLLNKEHYHPAAFYQRRGIEMEEQLSRSDTDEAEASVPSTKLKDMWEKLTEILIKCDETETDKQALMVLRDLLTWETEVRRQGHEADGGDRRYRLYHNLGRLHARQGNSSGARKFVSRAFQGRANMDPMPLGPVKESGELLAKILQENQEIDQARGIRQWIAHNTQPFSPTQRTSVGVDLSKAYQWCKENGFNVDSQSFRMDDIDENTHTIPMQYAIQEENQEVLNCMIPHVADLEKKDATGSTPFLLAAATRNRHICALLLEHEVTVDVQDFQGMSPLHRCQSRTGGLRVAEMILRECHELIDRRDRLGRTALWMACEKGNEPMVQLLLREGTNPNLAGPGKCTPLMVAIDATAYHSRNIAIVECLLKHKASPNIPDASGRDGFAASHNAGLAGEEIRRLLNSAVKQKMSHATRVSSASARSNRSSASTSEKSNDPNHSWQLV
ncbi:ankyrin [Xylariomycetidae sp. FL0641]|nr:ankyrin [Xylariomycetidae sp. FL0641]